MQLLKGEKKGHFMRAGRGEFLKNYLSWEIYDC